MCLCVLIMIKLRMVKSFSMYTRDEFIFTATQNAWDMLRDLVVLTRITTSSADLDRILSGGIKCREVTEIGWSSI